MNLSRVIFRARVTTRGSDIIRKPLKDTTSTFFSSIALEIVCIELLIKLGNYLECVNIVYISVLLSATKLVPLKKKEFLNSAVGKIIMLNIHVFQQYFQILVEQKPNHLDSFVLLDTK